MDDDRGVVQAVADPQRRADHQHRKQTLRRRHDLGDRALDLVEQGVLQQQVLDRVGRKPELGKDHDRGVRLVALGGEAQRLAEIEFRIGHAGARHATGHPQEFVGVKGVEIRDHGLGLRRWWARQGSNL